MDIKIKETIMIDDTVEKYLTEGDFKVGQTVLNNRTDAHGKITKIKGDSITVKWRFSKSSSDHKESELTVI